LWSGRRDSNSRQPAWKAGTLPTELLPHLRLNTGCEQFTKYLLDKFIKSRASGSSKKTLEIYQLTLGSFVCYPLTLEGINTYLNSLTCGNAKHNYYRCIKTLCRWLYLTDYLPTNPIEKVLPPRRQKKILPAISEEQLTTLVAHCLTERDKVTLNLLWYSGIRLSECANVKASDFNWSEGTVVILGKGNRYRKALAGNGIVKEWLSTHDSLGITPRGIQTMLQRLGQATSIRCNAHSFRRGFCIHQLKNGLSTRIVQALGGWDTISMVENYSKSLGFDEALSLYRQINTPS